MIIEKLTQKYPINCGKGVNKLEIPGLLPRLNMIIEWDLCKIPEGSPQELVPGDCFLLNKGQVIAVNDENTLILYLSESGPLALDRIYEEQIKCEFDLLFSDLDPGTEITWKSVSEVPDTHRTSYTPDYSLYKIWRDRFVTGRGFLENFIIELEYSSDMFLYMPQKIYMGPWKIWYNPSEIQEDMIKTVSEEILSWFYSNESRIVPQVVTESDDEDEGYTSCCSPNP